ncbi:MAG: DUF3990 domain-containing protein [Candidatus Obscuribacterales bacterium]|nr:DUF3990 domain-containing protein [Candidatus Obscuribacterales bacterium]
MAAPKTVWKNGPLTLYHGTLKLHVESVLSGIKLAESKGKPDFGRGFYTSTSIRQARKWSKIKQERYFQRKGKEEDTALVEFKVDREKLSELSCLFFVRWSPSNEDFWSLIYRFRGERGVGHKMDGSCYDVVVGPVATMRWEEKEAYQYYDQVGFHTDIAIALLDGSAKRVVN